MLWHEKESQKLCFSVYSKVGSNLDLAGIYTASLPLLSLPSSIHTRLHVDTRYQLLRVDLRNGVLLSVALGLLCLSTTLCQCKYYSSKSSSKQPIRLLIYLCNNLISYF